jgi:hypothetical protein
MVRSYKIESPTNQILKVEIIKKKSIVESVPNKIKARKQFIKGQIKI